jgi:hypothetical protein
MSGIRARKSALGALGRALLELRTSSQCRRSVVDAPAKEEFFRRVPSRSFGSFLEDRFSRQHGAAQWKNSGEFAERRWVTIKSLPQVCVRFSIS